VAEKVCFVLFMAGIVVWRAWETWRKQGQVRGQTSMQWSFYAMVALTALIFGGTVCEFFFVSRPHRLEISLLGMVLFVAANIMRIRAIRTLGRFWSLHVEIREQHEFRRVGPYRFVRHPAYASFVLEHLAVPLVGNAWWSFGAAVLLYVPMVLWRMRTEEAALAAKFGESYRSYQREVGALFPRLSAFRRRTTAG
jgi:protein-S-isoprenylcysteine O-methyltransferase Ste14